MAKAASTTMTSKRTPRTPQPGCAASTISAACNSRARWRADICACTGERGPLFHLDDGQQPIQLGDDVDFSRCCPNTLPQNGPALLAQRLAHGALCGHAAAVRALPTLGSGRKHAGFVGVFDADAS